MDRCFTGDLSRFDNCVRGEFNITLSCDGTLIEEWDFETDDGAPDMGDISRASDGHAEIAVAFYKVFEYLRDRKNAAD